ncbi:MAG: NusG domain II-containing protein [Clostridia bacterium]|nr:NusG domain II-containing protein [Clostridia bacterium]
MKKIKKQTVGDLAVIACVIIICGLWFSALQSGGKSPIAIIYKDGKIAEEAALSEDRVIRLDGVVIQISDGKIRFADADCPDRLCVKSGWLYKNGDTAACVPSKTVITIKNNREKAPYAVTF